MTSFVQVLGNHHFLVPPQLLLSHNQFRILFNAGENTQRFGLEHGVKFSKVTDIFLTRISPETIAGLPGLLLTLETGGHPLSSTKPECAPFCQKRWVPFKGPLGPDLCRSFQRIKVSDPLKLLNSFTQTVRIWGPPPLYDIFTRVSNNFAPLRFLNIELHELQPSTNTFSPNIVIPSKKCGISISFLCVTLDDHVTVKRTKLETQKSSDPVCHAETFSLIIAASFPSVAGKMSIETVEALKIPKGPCLAKLKAGESITLEDGRIIHPSDVCGNPKPGGRFIVVDIPNRGFIHLLNKPDIKTLMSSFCPNSIFDLSHPSAGLRQYYDTLFPKTSIVLPCCLRNETVSVEAFVASSCFSSVLRSILPTFYPSGMLSGIETHDIPLENAEIYNPLSQFIFYPETREGLDLSTALKQLKPTYTADRLDRLKAIDREVNICRNHFLAAEGILNKDSTQLKELSELPRVTAQFLGTGAAMPSKYRNVSATFIRINHKNYKKNILFDCGEGTLSQLFKFSENIGQFDEWLENICAVFISHRHADHHLGLPTLLTTRHARFKDATPVVIFGPAVISSWLEYWKENITSFQYSFVACEETLSIPIETTGPEMSLQLDAAPVDHIRSGYPEQPTGCFGVRLTISYENLSAQTTKKKITIVYSGDTRPCPSIVQLAKHCDILIHEATFEDDFSEEAINKRHSTIGEALDIATQAMVKFVLMTHFSQRYPSIPITSTTVPMAQMSAAMLDGVCIPISVLTNETTALEFANGFRTLQPILSALRDTA